MSYKSVLITGANRGLGFEMVRQLLARESGPEVVFAGCRLPANAQKLNKLSEEDQRLHVLKIDCDDPSTFEGAMKNVEAKVEDNGLNLLINNAGIFDTSPLSEVTFEKLEASFRINSISPLLMTKTFLPLLEAASKTIGGPMSSSRAAVVNMSSAYASTGGDDSVGEGSFYPYRASKAALNNIAHTLAYDLKSQGIAVICIDPGWVRTDMGGPDATLSPEESIKSVLSVVDCISEKHTGGYFDRSGQIMAF